MSTVSQPRAGYSGFQIALHWATAIAVVATWFLSDGMGRLLDARLEGGASTTWPWHVILGLTVLALVVIRLVTRAMQGAPDPAESGPHWMQTVGKWTHILLYVLLIAVPLGGIAMWFLGIEGAGEVHELGGNAILILAGIHAAAGLYHHYVLKDGTLKRMLHPV